MKKIILWSSVVVLIAGLGVGAFLLFFHHPPQVITLPDGTKLTLLGADYGKHHKYPTVKLPNGGRRTGNGPSSFDTPEDTLVVWILQEHKPNQWPNYQTLVYDRAETACVANWSGNTRQLRDGMEIAGVQLQAFPRRDKKFIVRFSTWGQQGRRISKEQFVIANPARGSFGKWTPTPLPISQSDGDLEVRLTKLVGGAQSSYNRGGGVNRNDAMNKGVQLNFDCLQNDQPATNWRPVQVETSDVTGNKVKGWINQYYQNGKTEGYFYESGLWPDEAAWKLRLEFSRTAGFSDTELWSVTNIPVEAGTQQEVWNDWNDSKKKTAFAETTLNGSNWKIFPAIQYTEQGSSSGKSLSLSLRTDHDPEPDGFRVTLVSVTDDQGRTFQNQGSSWGGGNYRYQFQNARNVKTLNVTVAVHKSRFVEFTAKPQKAEAATTK